jgi:hypothetical protein
VLLDTLCAFAQAVFSFDLNWHILKTFMPFYFVCLLKSLSYCVLWCQKLQKFKGVKLSILVVLRRRLASSVSNYVMFSLGNLCKRKADFCSSLKHISSITIMATDSSPFSSTLVSPAELQAALAGTSCPHRIVPVAAGLTSHLPSYLTHHIPGSM